MEIDGKSSVTIKKHELKLIDAAKIVTLRRNPQYLTPAQMESLKASIRRDGFCAPILVRTIKGGRFEVVSGNHRFMAAQELGLKMIPCVIADMTDREAKRLAINLNTIHGEPNAELLAPFLAELDISLLREIHIEPEMKADLMQFDDVLGKTLAKLEAPSQIDSDSPRHSVRTCKCPHCGSTHLKKSKSKV